MAFLAMLLVAAAATATPGKAGSSCAHPLKTGQSFKGDPVGDTKDMTAAAVPNGPQSSSEKAYILAIAKSHRVVVCRAELLFARPPANKPVTHHIVKLVIEGNDAGQSSKITLPAHTAIADWIYFRLKGAASSARAGVSAAAKPSTPKTVAACKRVYAHNSKARMACIKRVTHSGTSAKCSIKTKWTLEGGFLGAPRDFPKKEFSARLKMLKTPTPHSWNAATVAAQVTVHNPRIVICSAVLGVTVRNLSTPWLAEGIEYHLAIGPHGGLSSSVTMPPEMFGGTLEVYARRK